MALLTPPPAAPQRGDRTTFASRVDAFITWLINFVSELLALVANLNSIAAGGAYAIPYIVNTTFVNHNGGRLYVGNGVQNLITAFPIDGKDSTGTDWSTLFSNLAAGTSANKCDIRMVKAGDPTKFLAFRVTQLTYYGTYGDYSVTCTGSSSASPFIDGDAVMVYFQRTGDKGDMPSLVTGVLHVRDEKAGGTSGGTSVGTNTRTLNTTKRNTLGATVSGNQFTLPAGTYRMQGNAPTGSNAGGAGVKHQAWFYNVTAGSIAAVGSSEWCVSAGTSSRSVISPIEIVLAAPTTFELRHYLSQTANSQDLGAPASSGNIEVYSEVFVEKLA
jgi:hypothetical protein